MVRKFIASMAVTLFALSVCLLNCRTAAGASNVSVRQTARQVVVNNGLIRVVFSRRRARIISLIDESAGRRQELLNRQFGIYFDANGIRTSPPRYPSNAPRRRTYFVPLTGKGMQVIQHAGRSAEVIFNGPPSYWFPFSEQVHFEIRRGQSGIYGWVIFHHKAGAPGGSIAQTRFVVKAADGHSVFHDWAVDKYAVRSPLMGTLPEERIVQKLQDVTELLSNGRIWCKYDYCLFGYQFLCYGLAGPHVGLWMDFPGRSYINGGPLRQDLTVHQQRVGRRLTKNNILAMFDGGHFGAPGIHVRRNQDWIKFFGPVFIAVNNGGSPMGMYQAARRLARQLRRHRPFQWLKSPYYPLVRGEVSGSVHEADGGSAAGAWAVLSPDNPTDWSMQARGYEFWTRVKTDGTFVITKVRPGDYKLSLTGANHFANFVTHHVHVAPDKVTQLGNLVWRRHTKGKIIWEIGTADRSTREFFDGNNVRHYSNFLRYSASFPRDVTYTIGRSTPAKDWNFAQWGWYCKKPWWTIRFNLAATPPGTATLTLGLCATLIPHGGLAVGINGRRVSVLHLRKSGAAVYRSGGQDSLYQVRYVQFPAKLLKPGLNRMTIGFTNPVRVPASSKARQQYRAFRIGAVMYDALRLSVQQ